MRTCFLHRFKDCVVIFDRLVLSMSSIFAECRGLREEDNLVHGVDFVLTSTLTPSNTYGLSSGKLDAKYEAMLFSCIGFRLDELYARDMVGMPSPSSSLCDVCMLLVHVLHFSFQNRTDSGFQPGIDIKWENIVPCSDWWTPAGSAL